MPHLTLEYSSNIRENLDTEALLEGMNAAVASFETFKLKAIKSRCIRIDNFRSGDGSPTNAFVHATLSILAGRDAVTKKALAEKLFALFRATFKESLAARRLDISLEIRDMPKDAYFIFSQETV